MNAVPSMTKPDSGSPEAPPSLSPPLRFPKRRSGLLLSAMFMKELVSQGWQALMRDRTRSALTMLGIGWGLVSVVLLLAYGQGLGGCVLQRLPEHGEQCHRALARADQHAGRRPARRQER